MWVLNILIISVLNWANPLNQRRANSDGNSSGHTVWSGCPAHQEGKCDLSRNDVCHRFLPEAI